MANEKQGISISDNVKIVPNAKGKTVVTSGAQQVQHQNANLTNSRLGPSSPTSGANEGKPYPGGKQTTPTNEFAMNKATAEDSARALKAANKPTKGTQAGHAITDHTNHTRTVGGGAGGGAIQSAFGGGGLAEETR